MFPFLFASRLEKFREVTQNQFKTFVIYLSFPNFWNCSLKARWGAFRPIKSGKGASHSFRKECSFRLPIPLIVFFNWLRKVTSDSISSDATACIQRDLSWHSRKFCQIEIFRGMKREIRTRQQITLGSFSLGALSARQVCFPITFPSWYEKSPKEKKLYILFSNPYKMRRIFRDMPYRKISLGLQSQSSISASRLHTMINGKLSHHF